MLHLSKILWEMGDAGQRMSQINAAEGAAGNISVFVRNLPPTEEHLFPFWFENSIRNPISLPVTVPSLVGGWVIVSGSGKRMRDIATIPEVALCLLQIQPGGETAILHTADPSLRPTSELNSHLAVHNDRVAEQNLSYHTVLHAQPLHLTYLSHIDRYGDTKALNRHLLRWQPETILEFPEGIGVSPFEIPASAEQAQQTVEILRQHRAVVWRRHGIVVRCDAGPRKAGDLVEYAEAAAQYEYLNLKAGEPSGGISDEEMRQMCQRFGIDYLMYSQFN